MLRLALSVFLVLMLASPWQFAPPSDAHEAFVITDLGNIFPVENKTVGGSSSAVKNIAYNLMLQGAVMETVSFSGMVLHGDVATEAEREDLDEWVVINPTTKHAGAILDGTGITMAVPRFYSTYSHAGSSITETSHNPPVDLINIQGHKTVYGSVAETGVQSGMTFSGTGWSIVKLGPVAGGSYIIEGTVPPGASVQQISSPNNMLGTYYDGSRYVLVNNGAFYATTSGKTAWHYTFGHDGFSNSNRVWSWVGGQQFWTGNCNHPCVRFDSNDNPDDLIQKTLWSSTSYYHHGYFYYVPDYGELKLQSGLPVYIKDTPSYTQTHLPTSASSASVVLTNVDYRFTQGTSLDPYGEVMYPPVTAHGDTIITTSFFA